jgi:hypothetical protein
MTFKAKIFGRVLDQGVKYFQYQAHLSQMIEQLDLNELELTSWGR